MNIYNFASNEAEWTLEKTSYSNSPCAGRGGSYHGTGWNGPASHRLLDGRTTAYDYVGFRPVLYVN